MKASLSEKLCQDPLEDASGRETESMKTQIAKTSARTPRVVNSFVGPVKGNCRGSKTEMKIDTDNENKPLPKQ